MAAETRTIRLVVDASKAEQHLKSLNKGMTKLNASTSKMAKTLKRFQSSLLIAAGGFGVSQIFEMADAWTAASNRLGVFTDTAAETAQVMDSLMGVAQDTFSTFDSTVTIFNRLRMSTESLNLSEQELLDTTEAINRTFLLAGATAMEANSAARQLAQGLGSGALQGEELRAVLESNIPLAQIIAKEFGVMTGELKNLGADGLLIPERIIPAIISSLAQLQAQTADFQPTIGHGFTVLANGFTELLGSINEGSGVFAAFADSLVFLGKNLEAIATLLVGGGLIMAIKKLLVMFPLLTVEVNALNLALIAATARMKGLAIAGAFLWRVMGGWIGVAVAAVVGSAALILSLDEEERSVSALSGAYDGLASSLDKLGESQMATKLRAQSGALLALRQTAVIAMQALQDALREGEMSGESTESLLKFDATIRQLQGNVISLVRDITFFEDRVKTTAEAAEGLADAAKKEADALKFAAGPIGKMIQGYRDRIALIGKTEEETAKMVAAQKVESAITAALAKDNKELAAQYRANKSLIVGLAGEIERLTLAEKALNDEFENAIKQEKENIKVGEDALQTNQALISSLEEEIKMLQMSGAELAVYVELQKLDAKVTTEQTAAFSAQVEALVSQREALKAASLAGEEYTDVMNDQLSQGEQLFQGMTRGIENYGEEAQDVFSMAKKAASSAFSSMEDALVDMASSGKMAFSDMATSILKDILRIVIRAQILGPIAQMLGGSMASGFGAPATASPRMAAPNPFSSFSGPDAAKGASFRVPGTGGSDSVMMGMRVTPGEHVQVTPPGKSGMGGGFSQTVNVVNNVPEARVSTQTGPNGRDLEIYIEQVAARSISNNGAVGRAMDQSRGTAPRGIPR